MFTELFFHRQFLLDVVVFENKKLLISLKSWNGIRIKKNVNLCKSPKNQSFAVFRTIPKFLCKKERKAEVWFMKIRVSCITDVIKYSRSLVQCEFKKCKNFPVITAKKVHTNLLLDSRVFLNAFLIPYWLVSSKIKLIQNPETSVRNCFLSDCRQNVGSL